MVEIKPARLLLQLSSPTSTLRLYSISMDIVSPILDVANHLWNCTARRAVYIRRLPQNLNSLRTKMDDLKRVYMDVKEKVEREERLQKKRTHVVDGWLSRVEALEKEVSELLAKGDVEIQKKCMGTCCPTNCCASYELGKMVVGRVEAVTEKMVEGSKYLEGMVAEPLPAGRPGMERALGKTSGHDYLFEKVLKWILKGGEDGSKIGIYGMGGVGKTTLLTRINNDLLNTTQFDAVIWITVSRAAKVEKVQRVIWNKLEIPDSKWESRGEDERAEEILKVLKTKKFVLLLDDMWERLDLSTCGVPHPPHKSKLVFTTRSKDVCVAMEATKSIEVNCLPREEAFALFQDKVGAETMNSHPDIPKLAEGAAKLCDGLPLALITIGRAMAGAKTPEEWEKKIQLLENYPAKFPGMEDHIFNRLAFSYDSLPDESTKSCFLYCSLFPEDYEIPSQQLIQLWIGEGFLGEHHHIPDARTQGEELIESLHHACLLEKVVTSTYPFDEEKLYFKMHDVIRDMALWLACENGKKKNKFVVKDGVGLIKAQEVESWEETERLSLWGNSFIQLWKKPPPCLSNIATLFCPSSQWPNGFFTEMRNIGVLDFSSNSLINELPPEIGNLLTLQYLNLSRTKIRYIPVELKNLTNLRCLILDDMLSLKSFPSEIVSMLSSLRLFSMYAVSFLLDAHPKDENEILERLEMLEHIDDISFTLSSPLSTQTLINSHKLRRFTRRISLRHHLFRNEDKGDRDRDGMKLFQLSPYVETLNIQMCRELQEVKRYLEKEVVLLAQVCSKFLQLRDVSIFGCDKLPNLTWLTNAPKLQYLSIQMCKSLEEVISNENGRRGEEVRKTRVENHSCVFSRLISLILFDLPKLWSIYSCALLPFPSLTTVIVRRCPRLKKLPFDCSVGVSKKLEKIHGKQEWWDGLEWEDPTIKHNLTPYFRL